MTEASVSAFTKRGSGSHSGAWEEVRAECEALNVRFILSNMYTSMRWATDEQPCKAWQNGSITIWQ